MTANLSILDNFLQFFFFHFRDICDDIYYFYTLFFFSSPREIARSGHTTERWKCVLSICTAYVASDATRTRCHVDAHLSVKASCALCPFKRTFVALVANISLFFPRTGDVATELRRVEFQPSVAHGSCSRER